MESCVVHSNTLPTMVHGPQEFSIIIWQHLAPSPPHSPHEDVLCMYMDWTLGTITYNQMFRFMVYNATFNNISVISCPYSEKIIATYKYLPIIFFFGHFSLFCQVCTYLKKSIAENIRFYGNWITNITKRFTLHSN